MERKRWEFQQAEKARVAQMRLEIELIKAKAQLNYSEAFKDKWSGNLPEKILPEGSQFLFNLD